MKVILLQDVPKVGKKFDIKTISDGYAVNFLLPQKLAKLATNQVIKELTNLKEKHEQEQQKMVENSKELIKKLNEKVIDIEVKTSQEGKLFAGLDKKEIAKIIKDKTGIEIDPEILQLEKPLKKVGEYEIKIKVEQEEGKFSLQIKAL